MATVITQETSATWSGTSRRRLNQQTAALLKEIQAAPGTRSAMVYDNHGKLLAAYISEDIERNVLDLAGLDLAQVFAALEARGGKPKQIELRFERMRLLAQDLGNAFVAVVCTPNVNWSTLRMTVNVAAAQFEANTELQTDLRVAAPVRRDTLTQSYLDDAAWQLAVNASLSLTQLSTAN